MNPINSRDKLMETKKKNERSKNSPGEAVEDLI